MPALRSATSAAVIALFFAGPAVAQSAGDMSYGVLNGAVPALAPATTQPATSTPAGAAYPQPGYATPSSYIDCNNPYYTQYCQAYAAWYNQYYGSYAYDYTNPYYGYGFYDYGYPVGVGFTFFDHGRFHHDFDHRGFEHHAGMFHEGFHGGFHGGGHGGGHGGSHR